MLHIGLYLTAIHFENDCFLIYMYLTSFTVLGVASLVLSRGRRARAATIGCILRNEPWAYLKTSSTRGRAYTPVLPVTPSAVYWNQTSSIWSWPKISTVLLRFPLIDRVLSAQCCTWCRWSGRRCRRRRRCSGHESRVFAMIAGPLAVSPALASTAILGRSADATATSIRFPVLANLQPLEIYIFKQLPKLWWS